MTEKKPDVSEKKKNWFERHPIASVLIAVIFIGGIFGSLGKHEPTAPSTTSPAASTSPDTTPEASKKPAVPTEYTSALNSADSYANRMNMSKQGVYDQLTSQYGGQFTAEAAQYAIDNVKSDWNKNALASAKSYEKMNMSPAAIHDQLTSSAGAQFTVAEADYAIAHLND